MRRMLAAIYARYSSDNQRPESIEDQEQVCRTAAAGSGYRVADVHVYKDYALSGAFLERPALGGRWSATAPGRVSATPCTTPSESTPGTTPSH